MESATDNSNTNALLSELQQLELLVIGFPKAGTTSLAEWLAGQAAFRVTKPKETFCLCPEFKHVHESMGGSRIREALGSTSPKGRSPSPGSPAPLRVEATSLNIYSDILLGCIEQLTTKIIILTRAHPAAVKSWHAQMKFANLIPTDQSLREMWQESLTREVASYEDIRYHYSYVFSQAHWIDKWVNALGHERVLLVDMADLRNHEQLAIRLSTFMGIELDSSEALPNSNTRFSGNVKLMRLFRNGWVRRLSHFLDRQGFPINKLKAKVKKILNRIPADQKGESVDDDSLMQDIRHYYRKDAVRLAELMEQNTMQHTELK